MLQYKLYSTYKKEIMTGHCGQLSILGFERSGIHFCLISTASKLMSHFIFHCSIGSRIYTCEQLRPGQLYVYVRGSQIPLLCPLRLPYLYTILTTQDIKLGTYLSVNLWRTQTISKHIEDGCPWINKNDCFFCSILQIDEP